MVEVAGTAGRDDGDGHRRRHRRRQLAVEALLGAVAVDRGQQYLAGAAVGRLARPLHRVALGALLAAAHVDAEAPALALGVDGDDDGLAAVAPGQGGDELGLGEGGGVDADLVGAGLDGGLGVVLAADAAADAQRQEYLARDGADGLGQRLASLDGRGDVEDDDLVDALAVVAAGEGGGVAGVAQTLEVDALDDGAVPNVEAGDDAFRQHGARLRRMGPGAGSCRGCGGRRRTTSRGGTAPRRPGPARPRPRTRRRSGSTPRSSR